MNNRYGIFSIFFLIILSACNKQEAVELPFPREKVVAILADVHVSEAALQPLFGEVKDSISKIYYQQIYEIHDIDSEQLKALMTTLKDHPKEMEAIYEEVIDEISRQKANISSAKESPEDEKIDTIDQSILKAKSERDSN
ncbi:MAG: DUF4296 domain-containing protein [Saprospiraceae bacterium]